MNINGTWYNELGSQMIIQAEGKTISGKYHTAVGDAAGAYDLIGQMDTDNDQSTAIGWVVVWSNQHGSSDSVTAWSGQVQIVNREESIITTWLLTAETEEDDDWHSTLIGKDIFTRLQPTQEQMAANIQKGIKASSPK